MLLLDVLVADVGCLRLMIVHHLVLLLALQIHQRLLMLELLLVHLAQKLLPDPVVALVLWDIENVAYDICTLLRLAIVARHHRNSIFVCTIHKVDL